MKVHEDWFTPKSLVDSLGRFDLDPSSDEPRPWPTAIIHFTKADDGLAKEWFGRVWMNPPHDKTTPLWVEKFKAHGKGISLLFYQPPMPQGAIVYVLKDRLAFHRENGKQWHKEQCQCCLITFDEAEREEIDQSGLVGYYAE